MVSSRNPRRNWTGRWCCFPRNVPISIRLSETLMKAGDNKRAQLILDDLFNVGRTDSRSNEAHRQGRARGRRCRGLVLLLSYYYVMTGDLKNVREPAAARPGSSRAGPSATRTVSVRGSRRCAPRCPRSTRTRSPTITAAAAATADTNRLRFRSIRYARRAGNILLGRLSDMPSNRAARMALG